MATLALGCMNFGGRTPEAESVAIVERALEAGIGAFDTANVYTDGRSETIVGRALRGRAPIGTKVGLARRDGRPEGLAPERVLAACDESRRRLGVDVIDLYTLHAPDPKVQVEATLDAIAALLERGAIRAWGVSNHASWQILELRTLALARGMPAPAASQQIYNVLVRQLELEYFRYAAKFPIHTTVYNPLAGGLLTGRHTFESPPPKGGRFDKNPMYRGRYWTQGAFDAVDAVRAVAAEEGMSLVALAYAFVLGAPGVDSVLVGPGSVAHLDDALAAREVTLSPGARQRLDGIHRARQGTDVSYAR